MGGVRWDAHRAPAHGRLGQPGGAGIERAERRLSRCRTARLWSIRWLDGRYPSNPLDPPVKGSFENGVGAFYADYVANGKLMRVRFIWSHITPTVARWEQAYAADAGKTWETN
jgi:hypothetical protein